MNVKITMINGEELFSEIDKKAKDFIKRSFVGSQGIKFIPLTTDESVWINTANVSSVHNM